MGDAFYIWEKVDVAVGCLASGSGSFEERFWNASISALDRILPIDIPPELADDLNWVKQQSEHYNLAEHETMKPIPELERMQIADKLVHARTRRGRKVFLDVQLP